MSYFVAVLVRVISLGSATDVRSVHCTNDEIGIARSRRSRRCGRHIEVSLGRCVGFPWFPPRDLHTLPNSFIKPKKCGRVAKE